MPTWVRATAETMPWVTVWPTAKGLPMASTTSPTSSASESANSSAGKHSFSALMRNTARSERESLSTISASNSRLSASDTLTWSAPSMTWLLVTTRPVGSTSTPEPSERWIWSPEPPGAPGTPKKRRKMGSSKSGLPRTVTVLAAYEGRGVAGQDYGTSRIRAPKLARFSPVRGPRAAPPDRTDPRLSGCRRQRRDLRRGLRHRRNRHELRDARIALSQSLFRQRHLYLGGADLHGADRADGGVFFRRSARRPNRLAGAAGAHGDHRIGLSPGTAELCSSHPRGGARRDR